MTGSSGLTASTTYTYDLDGNRTSATIGGVTTTYTFDRTNQLIDQTVGGTTTTFRYDLRGNLKAKATNGSTTTVMEVDSAGRLITIDPAAGATATYDFDALGRTVTRSLSGGGPPTETYRFNGTSEAVTAIIGTNGAASIDAILDPTGARLGLSDGASTNWTLFDPHGDLAAQLSTAGSIVRAYRYDPYGLEVTTPAGGIASPWRYQGALDSSPDATDPLYDIGARTYAPSLGAWTALDTYAGTAADPRSLNRYLYAAANPATLIDPTGRAGCKVGPKCTSGNQIITVDQDGTAHQHGPTTGSRGGSAGGSSSPTSTYTHEDSHAPSTGGGYQNWTLPSAAPVTWVCSGIGSCHQVTDGAIQVATDDEAERARQGLTAVATGIAGGVWDFGVGLAELAAVAMNCTTPGAAVLNGCPLVDLAVAAATDPRGTTSAAFLGAADLLGDLHRDLTSGDAERVAHASTSVLLFFESFLVGAKGGGAPAATTTAADAPAVVIGRSMRTRVIPKATELDAGYYRGAPAFVSNLGMRANVLWNQAWLAVQMLKGKRIFDVGEPRLSPLPPSPFYDAEQWLLRVTRYPVTKLDLGD